MIGELSILSEWIPEQMEPGTIFVLENAGEMGEKEDPYWAVLSCPSCGQLGLVTRKQISRAAPGHSAARRNARPNSSSAMRRSCIASPTSPLHNLPWRAN